MRVKENGGLQRGMMELLGWMLTCQKMVTTWNAGVSRFTGDGRTLGGGHTAHPVALHGESVMDRGASGC